MYIYIHTYIYIYLHIYIIDANMEKGRQVRSHISLDFVGIPQGEMKIFYMNTRKWASPAMWDRVFLNAPACFGSFQIQFQHPQQPQHPLIKIFSPR